MRTATHIMQFVLAAVIVVVIGMTLGWYAFTHRQIQATKSADAARGAGIAPSFGSPQGSTFQNSLDGTGTSASVQSASGHAAPRLWQVAKSPVAGFGFDAASTTAILFVERATGNVLLATPADSGIERLTNTLLPKIYEASFVGEHPFVRSLEGETITTYAGTISAATSTGEVGTLAGVYLPKGIAALAPRTASEIGFLLANPQGGAIGITSDLAGKNQKAFFSSALSQWRLIGEGDGTLYLVQKAADGVSGYSFILGKDGALKSLIENVPGLVISPRASSTALLWSSSTGNALTLFARASSNASAVTLPIHTIAEKCAWAQSGELIAYCAVPRTVASASFLNDWYAGVLHTTDTLWRVDVSAGTAEQFFTTDSSLSLDVRDPQVDPTNTYLSFINATDNTLYVLRIAQ